MKEKAPPLKDVLLVDDDPASLAMLALSLRGAGLSVVACASPVAALAELKRGRYRWLVTDFRMLPQDGLALADQAKSLAPRTRIVMISASCTASDIDGRPIERLFTKPVPVEILSAYLSSPTP